VIRQLRHAAARPLLPGQRNIRDLKNIREARGMSASLVADIVGVHRSVISKFENQTGDPKLSMLLRYAHAVGVDLALTVVNPLLDDKPATTNSRSKAPPQ
jgi:transcriptional regulator with XRE-family HTH domain